MNRQLPSHLSLKGAQVSKTLAAGLLLLFLTAGLALRLQALGTHGFWTDELLHVIGAKSLLETGAPTVPGKGEYLRAFPVTAITALSFRWLGESEIAARLPFVLINLLFVVAGYFVVARLFGTNIALIFAFIMAFSPLEMVMSRECRMYSLFQLLYFLGSMCFFLGFEAGSLRREGSGGADADGPRRSTGLRVAYLGLSGILLYLSLKTHELTLNFGIALAVYLFLMAIHVAVRNGIREALLSKYAAVLGLVVVGGGVALLLFPDFFLARFRMAISVPDWANGETYSYRYYQTYFTRHYPVFTYIYPISILLMVIQYREKGVFLLSSFVPVLIAHSLVYTGRVSERYIFYIFPFFILGSAYVVERTIAVGYGLIREYRGVQSKVVYAMLLVCLLPAFYVFAKPWLGETRYVKDQYFGMDWKSVAAELQEIPKDSLIISTRIKPIYYYAGRMPDYNVRKSLFEISEKSVKVGGKTLSIQIVDNAPDLERIVKRGRAAYFLAEKWSWELPVYMDDSMRRVIAEHFVRVPHGGNKDIMIYKSR